MITWKADPKGNYTLKTKYHWMFKQENIDNPEQSNNNDISRTWKKLWSLQT